MLGRMLRFPYPRLNEFATSVHDTLDANPD